MPIVIVDYCKGNLRSVQRGIEQAGYDAFISSDPRRIKEADAIVLPGVGAFADAAATMRELGQIDAIRSHVIDDGVPFLGICLGLHLLLTAGDEGTVDGGLTQGLGLVSGQCLRLEDGHTQGMRVKIPHVGWNSLQFDDCVKSPLFEGVPSGAYFYFTHSYQACPSSDKVVTSRTKHALPFVSSIKQGNLYGTQFHPEKSSGAGLMVLRNFGRIVYGSSMSK